MMGIRFISSQKIIRCVIAGLTTNPSLGRYRIEYGMTEHLYFDHKRFANCSKNSLVYT
ncbi:hypothetical protein DTO96_102230 [Ephemeroptericola cinctiostellae]|uniref:Uncharacterized protein n=1 Tax=Ephemeroptericola cinctiostellae TaxID=2268024 RepID=A0A345DDN8_9BURK|nr:hypothetical protein DTO96_102230 [Ephemeroptericola cinctiostellae]